MTDQNATKVKLLKRYQWEDTLIKTQLFGGITNGGLLTALKMASAMNWRLGGVLRMSNDLFCIEYGMARSVFYKNKTELIEIGFLDHKSGNYIAKIPKFNIESVKLNNRIELKTEQYKKKKIQWESNKNQKRLRSGFNTDESGNDIL